jgi:hypothetical protein
MKKQFQFRTLLLLAIVTIASLSQSLAQQTKKISLQGFLKDANGKAVADGSQEITFKLYNVATGGTAEWTDTQNINVFGGVYSTHLGSSTNPVDALNWGSSTYFVGVTVQGTELTPRTELTFAPYSLGSPKAQEVVCSGAVGDVKHSILNPTQFAAVNGNCWVPMDGRSIAGSKLSAILGTNTMANAGGLFIRSQEFDNSSNYDPNRTSSTPIATLEDQATQQHTHTFSGNTSTDGNHSHGYSLPYRSEETGWGQQGFSAFKITDRAIDAYNGRQTDSAGNHSHSYSGTTSNHNGFSADETRPKNLNFWVYIRIN